MEVRLHPDLSGQVALVSGATRGLGAAIAARLASFGAVVFAGARDPSDIEEAPTGTDGKVHPVRLDVTSQEDAEAAVAHAVRVGGRLDILVNNAGIGDWGGRTLETLDPELLDKVLATNLRGPILLTKAALPHLVRNPGGRVVNMSSGMGALGDGMGHASPAYRISKTGINGLTVYLDAEYQAQGLIANSACPGWVQTDMGGDEAPRSVDEGADTPVWLARFTPGSPSGRFWRDRAVIDW